MSTPDGEACMSWWEQTYLTTSSKQKVQTGVLGKLVKQNVQTKFLHVTVKTAVLETIAAIGQEDCATDVITRSVRD